MISHADQLGLCVEATAAALQASLASLPSVVRYFDDFTQETHSIRDLANAEFIHLALDGCRHLIDFRSFRPLEHVLKHVVVDWLNRLDPHTVCINADRVRRYVLRCGIGSLAKLVAGPPYETRAHWNAFVVGNVTAHESWSLRALMHSLCRLNIGNWNSHAASIVKALASPKVDKYRVVRAGDCFVPLDQQAFIVNHIDELAGSLAADPASLPDDRLRNACMLVMSYQYAFRPAQIALVESADVRVFNTGAVHVAVPVIKQQDRQKRTRVNRRIKREWGPLFAEFVKRREGDWIAVEEGVPPRLLFGLTPPAVSRSLIELTEDLTGEPWTPTDLRHTAAQRLADGGISHAGLTDFLTQTSPRIANVYYDNSPSQAQRINEALAISPIYSNVAKVAKTRTIDKATLLGLPADKQIGGVPHGIPIAGIGGCELGQSLCVKNPVISCYNCWRFMPIDAVDIHQQVLDDLRPVVIQFAAASRNNQQSPAYAQLKSTLDAVRRVVEELNAGDEPEGVL